MTAHTLRSQEQQGSRFAPRLLLAALGAGLLGVACSESLENSTGCPLLCPSQSLDIREAVYDAIEYDATVRGFPPLGTAQYFTLASSGDSLESRVVIRFDSLPNTYTLGGVSIPVSGVDSAHLRVFFDTLVTRIRATATIELYDVDTTAADGDFDAVRALFRPDRLITTHVLQPAQRTDTVEIAIPNATLLQKIQSPARRLRIGFRIRSDSTARLALLTANQTRFPRLRYDPAPTDPNVNVFERPPRSFTPVDDPAIAVDFTDYSIPVAGPFPLRRNTVGLDTADVFRDSVVAAGGVAGRRAYFRFTIPDSVLSTSIVRATLILHKKPSSDYGVGDTIAVVPQAVFASATVPVSRAALLNDSTRVFPMTSIRLEPKTSGEVRFDIIPYARTWSIETRDQIPLAITLRVGQEGRTIHEILFYSMSAPTGLRPQLRLTFVPRLQIGPP